MTQDPPRFATIASLMAHRKHLQWSSDDQHGYQDSMRAGVRHWAHDDGAGFDATAIARRGLHGLTSEQLLDHHSLFPLLAALLPPTQLTFWRQAMLEGKPIAAKLIADCRRVGLLQRGAKAYCPACVGEDLEAHGDASFWRTYHQLPFVRNCVVHGHALKYACRECHTPYLRSDWDRQPHHPCRICRSHDIAHHERPDGMPGRHDLEALVSGLLFGEASMDVDAARTVEAAALMKTWNCASEHELLANLQIVDRPMLTSLYRKVFGDEPLALRLAKTAFALRAGRGGVPALCSTSDTWLTRRNETRRRCPSWIPPTHLQLVSIGKTAN